VKSINGKFLLLALAVALYFGWGELSHRVGDTAVLHIPPTSRSQDTYVNLWVVEDDQGLWIRADRSSRMWLPYLYEAPVVELTRDGATRKYRAIIDDTERAREYVDPIFRRKYGLVDSARGLLRSKPVPIHLTRP